MAHQVPDEIWVWINDKQDGPFSLKQVDEFSQEGTIDRDTLYFEPSVNDWRPLSMLYKEAAAERRDYLRSSGMERCEFVGPAVPTDCEVCRGLDRQIFAIQEAPEIPPPGCTCNPWCKATLIAVR